MPLRNAFDALALDTTVAAVRDLLTTIRDNQFRRTDPLPAGNNTIGHVLTEVSAVTLLNLPSATRTTSGVSGSMDVGRLTRVAIDVNVSAASGVGQTLTFHLDRQGVDGLWYPIWTSPQVSAVGTVSTSVGQGMTVAQSLAATTRLRWTIGGTTPSFTFSASVVGK